jgi:drug/metabolite transporter (DMT)-like permease
MAMINVHPMFAATLGHIMLGETLQPVQVLAIGGSLLGVLLISKPDFVFGGEAATNLAPPFYRSPAMGYLMGTVSSVFGGVQYVIFRKVGAIRTHCSLRSAPYHCHTTTAIACVLSVNSLRVETPTHISNARCATPKG